MSDYQTTLLEVQRLNNNVSTGQGNNNLNYAISNGNLLASCASMVSFASYRSNSSAMNNMPVKATKDAVNFEALKRRLKIVAPK